MKKITILIVMALLCSFFWVNAQNHYTTKQLQVGDTIPDIILKNVVNYKSATIRLSDYSSQLIIVDFWGTLCIPCVEHLPAIYALQKKFKDQVFFLPVDIDVKWDPPAKIKKFFKAREKAFNLPSVVADTVLRNLFQPQYMGLYVWIKNGVIQEYTDGDQVTSENISKVLNGQKINLKQNERTVNDWTKPLFDNGNGNVLPSTYLTRSILFPYSSNLVSGGRFTDSTGKVYRLFYANTSIKSLLLLANPGYIGFYERVKIKSKHPEMLREDFDTDSARRINAYCYEAIFPPVSAEKAAKYIKQDMERYFPFMLDSMRVVDTCWVLKLSKQQKLKIGDRKIIGSTNMYEHLNLPIYFHNRPLSQLRFELEHNFKLPVLDETGYSDNVWLDLPAEITNSKMVAKSLEKQGIILTKAVRAVEFLVIKDLPNSN